MTIVEEARDSAPTAIPVEIGKPRGGPRDRRTLRKDSWWQSPTVTVVILSTFVGYSTFAAFQGRNYYVGSGRHRNLLSPFYSPCMTHACVAGSHPLGIWFQFWQFSPALLVLIIPLGLRLTCYYYRKAYYRAFWQSPPACAVADGHARYTGETRFPLVWQNIHRYFFFLAFFLNIILTIDAIEAFRLPGEGVGMTIGTIFLLVNAALLWMYSSSCHSFRHICGGNLNEFSKHRIRYRIWKIVTPLNARHMQIAWTSLVVVGLTDLYVRLVAAGVFTDPKIFVVH